MSVSNTNKDRLEVLKTIRGMIKSGKFKTQSEIIKSLREKFNIHTSQSTISRYLTKLNIEPDPNTGFYVCSESITNKRNDKENMLYYVMRYAYPEIKRTKSTIRIYTDKPLENVITEAISVVYKKYIKGVIIGKGVIHIYITNKNDKSVTVLELVKKIKKELLSFRNSLDPALENIF